MKETNHGRPHMWFCSYEMPRISKNTETEKLVVTWGQGTLGFGDGSKRVWVSFWDDKKFFCLWWWLHNCEYIKHYWTAHLEWVSYKVAELHPNKAEKKKRKRKKRKRERGREGGRKRKLTAAGPLSSTQPVLSASHEHPPPPGLSTWAHYAGPLEYSH